MSLRSMRQDFRGHAAQVGMESAGLFVQQFGATAYFSYIGVDADRDARGNRHIHGQVYMVFGTAQGAGMYIPITPGDLESMVYALKGLPSTFPNHDAIVRNLTREITAAAQSMTSWSKTLTAMNPRAFTAPARAVA